MRLSFSNLAWERSDDPWVAELLQHHEIPSIDLTPAKYFEPGAVVADPAAGEVRSWWVERGIGIVGMQALFHGTTGLNLFGEPATRQRMLAHLERLCRIGAVLGATRLTFGAPRNRDRGELPPAAATARAEEFFRQLGDIAGAHQVTICLEPVPASYGCNFMTDTASAAAIVRGTDHPAIRLQLDLGAIAANGEDLRTVLSQVAPLVGHVHLSERDLAPLGSLGTDHATAGKLLREWLPAQVLTVEMLAPAVSRRQDMECALQTVRSHYRE